MITVNFNNEYHHEYNDYLAIYEHLADKTINELGKEGNYEISVTLVDEDKIHKINKEYRNIDRVTDVISFENIDEFNLDEFIDLGDIFICVDQAIKQAKEYQHSLKRELSFLFVHGMLHCFGYDHLDKTSEEEMFNLQEVILSGE